MHDEIESRIDLYNSDPSTTPPPPFDSYPTITNLCKLAVPSTYSLLLKLISSEYVMRNTVVSGRLLTSVITSGEAVKDNNQDTFQTQLSLIRKIISISPSLVWTCKSAYSSASMLGRVDILEILLNEVGEGQKDGLDIDIGSGFTITHSAANQGHTHVLRYLNNSPVALKCGLSAFTGTLIETAAVCGHLETVSWLLKNKPVLEYSPWRVIAMCAKFGHLQVIRLLVQDYRSKGLGRAPFDITSLVHSVSNGRLEITKYLIEEKLVIEMGSQVVLNAIMYTESIDCLVYLIDNNLVKCSPEHLTSCAMYGNVLAFQYMYPKLCPPMTPRSSSSSKKKIGSIANVADLVCKAVQGGHLPFLQHLFANHRKEIVKTIDKGQLVETVIMLNKNLPILKYLTDKSLGLKLDKKHFIAVNSETFLAHFYKLSKDDESCYQLLHYLIIDLKWIDRYYFMSNGVPKLASQYGINVFKLLEPWIKDFEEVADLVAEQGSLEKLKYIHSKHHKCSVYGLEHAIRLGHTDCIRFIIESMKVDIPIREINTMIFFTMKSSTYKPMRYLIDRYSPILNQKVVAGSSETVPIDAYGITHQLVLSKRLDIAQLLFETYYQWVPTQERPDLYEELRLRTIPDYLSYLSPLFPIKNPYQLFCKCISFSVITPTTWVTLFQLIERYDIFEQYNNYHVQQTTFSIIGELLKKCPTLEDSKEYKIHILLKYKDKIKNCHDILPDTDPIVNYYYNKMTLK